MMDLPLYPVPRDDWQSKYDALLHDPYLQQKYNRTKSIEEHERFYRLNCPEVFTADRGLFVVDIGCGFGAGLEVLQAYGHDAIGIDSPSGLDGMGTNYHQLSRLMHERQSLAVSYVGWQRWIVDNDVLNGSVDLFISRGSIEQCFAEHLAGPPHHEHYDCKQQRWDSSVELACKFDLTFRFMAKKLATGGAIVIHANGTGTAKSDAWYSGNIRKAAADAGLTLDWQRSRLLHRWSKPG